MRNLLALSILVMACGGEEVVRRPRTIMRDDGTVQYEGGDTGKECEAVNRTQACACEALAGRQTCTSSFTWSACECLAPSAQGGAGMNGGVSNGFNDPAANKLEASFDWLRTDSNATPPACLPGHYEGNFDGGYQSPAAFGAPVPVFALDPTGMPGLRFDLGSSGNGEFLTVTGGMMDGVADGIFPFKAVIESGGLDCATGEFRAKLVDGSYEVFFLAFTGHFEGDLVARYDPATRSFVDGVWAVMEDGMAPPAIEAGMEPPVIPLGVPGGAGTWTTTWVR